MTDRRQRLILMVAACAALGYGWLRGGFLTIDSASIRSAWTSVHATTSAHPTTQLTAGEEKATFAAGCFWCVEADFDKLSGVISTTSGYTGGSLQNPSYEQVSRGGTGHAEAVEIVYDPSRVTYDQLLDHFWKSVDPLTANSQFCDHGDQYRPAIFVHNDEQRKAAEASKARAQQRFKEPVVVRIVSAAPFYRAETYHQDYYKKNPVQYRYYRWGCGRDARLKELGRGSSDYR